MIAKLNKKRLLFIVSTVVLVGIVVVGYYYLFNKDKVTYIQFNENIPFEYTKSEIDVNPTKKFTYHVDYDPTTLKGFNLGHSYSDAIAVYCEPSLSIKAQDAFVNYQNGKFVIAPYSDGLKVNDNISKDSVSLSKTGEWGFSDEYFIVQKLDSKTGSPLKKPLVTRFTVKKKVAKPVVSFSVDDKGIGHFSWMPIENASKYYIITMQEGTPWTRIVGSTNKTEWTTAEQDTNLQKDLSRGLAVSAQNIEFKNFNYSEDDLRDAKNPISADKQKFKNNMYGVIAVTDAGKSAFAVIKGNEIEKKLPYCTAFNAKSEMKANVSNIKTFDEIPTQLPITMADSSTVLRPIIVDYNNVKIGVTIHAIKENDGTISNRHLVPTCIIPYIVEGTMLKGEYRIESFDVKTYHRELQRISTRNKEARIKTGGTLVYTYSTQKKDLSKMVISRTSPSVSYKINATNSLTQYLAANMMQGNQYIDVSKHLSDKNGISVYDAAEEANEQNPYILGIKSLNYYSDRKVLEVVYKVSSKEERSKEQKVISAEVDRVASSIISKGMNDEQKVKAINDYITKTASYDYDALDAINSDKIDNFKHAWTPAGILLDKKAVCGGYAVTFKVLADKVGLKAMYVSGLANGVPHAWNKVNVNGVWRVIDVTWNDSAKEPNKYYLLTDKQANLTRTQENYFVIDVLAANYAAK